MASSSNLKTISHVFPTRRFDGAAFNSALPCLQPYRHTKYIIQTLSRTHVESLRSRRSPLSRGCCHHGYSADPTQLLLPTAMGTNSSDINDEYIFQPSPFRAHRRYIHASSESNPQSGDRDVDGSTTKKMSSSSLKSLSDDKASTSTSPAELHFETHQELVTSLEELKNDPLEVEGGRIVVHRGSTQAKLVIIGEAPGEQEDEQGIPFVGKAGQLLDKIFTYGGFNIETQVYITNIVKRRPAANRTPTATEVAFYMPYIREEIRLLKPSLIILAGSIAAKAFLGNHVTISKVRGKWFDSEDGQVLMPIFHPSYLLRKPVMKFEMVTDIQAIRERYMQLVPNDTLFALNK